MCNYKYEIGKIKILLNVFESTLIQKRMSAYLADFDTPELTINIVNSDNISYDPTFKIISSQGYRGYGMNEQGDYGIFDILNTPQNLCAALYINKDCTTVTGYVKDVESLGGASIHVRAFNMIGDAIKYAAICRDGFVFHSSTLDFSGKGILFSADSGTGKSTHTGLWKKYYPDNVRIINDDTPMIRILGDKPYVFGTPWSGKTDINENVCVPLKNIVFLERGLENELVSLDFPSAFQRFIKQSFIMPFTPLFHKYLSTAEKVLKQTDKIILKCNISKEAVDTIKKHVED